MFWTMEMVQELTQKFSEELRMPRCINAPASDALQAIKAWRPNFKIDMAMLDLPFKARGNQSRNRQVVRYNTIKPEEFGQHVALIASMLRTTESAVVVWFTRGKDSAREREQYLQCMAENGLKLAANGTWFKVSKAGRPLTWFNKPFPQEDILVYTQSGYWTNHDDLPEFDALAIGHNWFLPRPQGFPTAKPDKILQSLMRLAPENGWVLDPYAGSHSTHRAALATGRNCISIEIDPDTHKKYSL